MTEQIHDYDPADSLVDSEALAVFLADAYDTGDAVYIAKAMVIVARAKMRIEALEVLQRVRQGREAVHSAAAVRKDLGLDDLATVEKQPPLALTSQYNGSHNVYYVKLSITSLGAIDVIPLATP